MTWDGLSSTHLDSIGGASSRQQGPHISMLSAPGKSHLQDPSLKSALMHTMFVKIVGGKACRDNTVAESE
jgi:hypothetical protein